MIEKSEHDRIKSAKSGNLGKHPDCLYFDEFDT
jgi:hypothetical protein